MNPCPLNGVDEIKTPHDLGLYLRQLRGRLTQETVAKRSVVGSAALTRQRVSNIENGLLPTAEHLQCYLQACGRQELVDDLERVRREIERQSADVVVSKPPFYRSRIWRYSLPALAVVMTAAVVSASVTFLNRENTAPAQPPCPDGLICFWFTSDYSGELIQLSPVYYTGEKCFALPFVAHSVRNNSKERQRGFASADCSGTGTVLQHQGASASLINVASYRHS